MQRSRYLFSFDPNINIVVFRLNLPAFAINGFHPVLMYLKLIHKIFLCKSSQFFQFSQGYKTCEVWLEQMGQSQFNIMAIKIDSQRTSMTHEYSMDHWQVNKFKLVICQKTLPSIHNPKSELFWLVFCSVFLIFPDFCSALPNWKQEEFTPTYLGFSMFS